MRRIIMLWTVLALAATQAFAQTSATTNGVLVDNTGKYGAQRAALEKAAAAYGRPVKLYISNDLPDDIDLFSHERFRVWNMPAHGLLMCVFPDAHKVAITGGSALEAKGANGAFFRGTVIPGSFSPGWKKGGIVPAFTASLAAVDRRLATYEPASVPSAAGSVNYPAGEYYPGGYPAAPHSVFDDGPFGVFFLVVLGLICLGVLRRAAESGGSPRRRRFVAPPVPGAVYPHAHFVDNAGPDTSTAQVSSFDSTPDISSSGGCDFGGSSSGDSGGGFSDTGSGSF